MELVVDASALFAAIIGKSKTYDLFFVEKLRLVAVPYLFEEFKKNRAELASICGKPVSDIDEILLLLGEQIEIYPIFKFPSTIWSKANELAPHAKDAPYFALALYLKCAIWSREKAFKKQSVVPVFSTPELVEMFL